MPWLATPDAGFSTGEPWLPVADTHRPLAVALQTNDPASPLCRLRRFYAWRGRLAVLRRGDLSAVEAPEPILAFVRRTETERVLCLFNLSDDEIAVAVPAGLETMEVGGFEGRARWRGEHLVLQPWAMAAARY
jgi:alpha-glucosidase